MHPSPGRGRPATVCTVLSGRSRRIASFCSSLPRGVQRVPDPDGVAQDRFQGGRFENQQVRLAPKTEDNPFHEVPRDGAHVAEALGYDDVGGEAFEPVGVERVEAHFAGDRLVYLGVYSGSREGRIYPRLISFVSLSTPGGWSHS